MTVYSGLGFDLIMLLVYAAVAGAVMLYARRKHAIAFKNKQSERRYMYETATKQKDSEISENEWF